VPGHANAGKHERGLEPGSPGGRQGSAALPLTVWLLIMEAPTSHAHDDDRLF
jgi:hypothetical protein